MTPDEDSMSGDLKKARTAADDHNCLNEEIVGAQRLRTSAVWKKAAAHPLTRLLSLSSRLSRPEPSVGSTYRQDVKA